jgi:hypothetical protein
VERVIVRVVGDLVPCVVERVCYIVVGTHGSFGGVHVVDVVLLAVGGGLGH